ncbi:MAG: DNA-binding protein [bacterium]|nr:DNA-binding protein [bacterium]
MKSKKTKQGYVIRLESGERVMDSITTFCLTNGIEGGYFWGIGEASEAELMHYCHTTKKYSSKRIVAPLEIASLTGNVSVMDGEWVVHAHGVVADVTMQAFAGHLKEAIVSTSCEIVLVRIEDTIRRIHDEKLNLNLLDV